MTDQAHTICSFRGLSSNKRLHRRQSFIRLSRAASYVRVVPVRDFLAVPIKTRLQFSGEVF